MGSVSSEVEARKAKEQQDRIIFMIILIFGIVIIWLFAYLFLQVYDTNDALLANPCRESFDDPECTVYKYEAFCVSNNVNKELVSCKTHCRKLSEMLEETEGNKYDDLCLYEPTCQKLEPELEFWDCR